MDDTQLILAMVFGAIGLGYFTYGKRQKAAVPLIAGIGLCVFPFFITNDWLMAGVGIVLMAVPYFVRL
ncbi:MAG: amino acid transport protein [Planctomycetota bacterium]